MMRDEDEDPHSGALTIAAFAFVVIILLAIRLARHFFDR